MMVPIEILSNPRRSLRRAVSAPCDLWRSSSFQPLRCHATNVSVDGVWVEGDATPEPGEHIWLELGLPGDDRSFVLGGVVRRRALRRRQTDTEPPGLGIELTETPDSVRRALDEALRALPPLLTKYDALAAHTEVVWVEEIADEAEPQRVLGLLEEDAGLDEIRFFTSTHDRR
jgi:hypothetical protein